MRRRFSNRLILAALCLSGIFLAGGLAYGSTNISATANEHWSWNDVVGWMDFYGPQTANVASSGLTGYASSSIGDVSLDCHTSSAGNICNGSNNYQVANDGSGNLSGYAWNDLVGWISFCGGQSTSACPGSVTYRVLIDANGNFSGYAWNDLVGWISFNCSDPGVCGTSSYKVKTSWAPTSTLGYLDSMTFDTGISGGAQINSVVWQGSLPSPLNGAFVGFQLAVSNDPSGPWSYQGPDGTASTYYGSTASPNTSIPVSYTLHNNNRYFRYRITLVSNQTQTYSPQVDDVSVNWSH